MQKAIAFTGKGFEEAACAEAHEIISAKDVFAGETFIIFDVLDFLDLCSFCYMAQSINKAGALIVQFKAGRDIGAFSKNLEDAMGKCQTDSIKLLAKGKKSFKVECERHGEHDYKSTDAEIEAGKIIGDFLGKKEKIVLTPDYENPGVLFFIYIYEDKAFLCIDFSGFELSKRQYKIFNHPESLKGTTGFFLLKEAGFKKEMCIIDPFMGSGVIPIEAGLYAARFPVQFYNKEKLFFTGFEFFKEFGQEKFFSRHDSEISEDLPKIFGYDLQLRYLKAAQKNAKLAGIDKIITLSKVDLEWMDTKFEKGKVDLIATDPPRESKNKEENLMRRLFNELFYQAEYILKRGGRVALLARGCKLIEEAAEKHKFKIAKKHLIYQGKEPFNVLVFERRAK